jgi:succinyl-diaminopimelate desuccinylase
MHRGAELVERVRRDFGLPNATMHKLDEAVAVEDLHRLAAIYARILRTVVG